MDPAAFAAKWIGSQRTERAASQEHFIDLCRMLGQPTPNEADPTGDWYAFEKGADKLSGGDGFADVWKRGHFGWEYKGKRKDLSAAYKQLNDYREALENPPVLVVCDFNRFEVHTNFTGTVKEVHKFTLTDLAADPVEPLRVLRAVMTEPEVLRPQQTPEDLTEQAAQKFADIAIALRERGHAPQEVAHFLNKLLFCLFAEDVGLIPGGLIGRLADATLAKPERFTQQLKQIFGHMATKGGGYFGAEIIEWFNGNLFDDDQVVPLEAAEIGVLHDVSQLDWSEIEPAIFGTLFERGLDPDQRSQLGAHYTDRGSIVRLVESVLLAPLRREFELMKSEVEELVKDHPSAHQLPPARRKKVAARLETFLDQVRTVTVLDPACGSGNFLYVCLQSLKDLEREALLWGSLRLQLPMQLPRVGPHQLKGIEINVYAAELARVTIWIGEIQWMLRNGFAYLRDPILRPLHAIETRDALIDWSDSDDPAEADWPEADVIIGNPPFLGNRLLRRNLGHDYTEALWRIFKGRLPRTSDFVCYWHEKARSQIERGQARRAGLLATQAIRNSASRKVLERINETGAIFFALSSEPWVLAGAAVSLSFVGQDNGVEPTRTLDGQPTEAINANLTSGLDLTRAQRLAENDSICFYADVKAGPFDIGAEEAERLIAAPNPDGRDNRDVVRPWVNAADMTGRRRNMWIIDFGVDMPAGEAALYEAPFEYVRNHVRPVREQTRRASYRERWWLHAEPVRGMRHAVRDLTRYIVTPAVSKHRVFAWLSADTLADHQLVVIARDDDYTFGVLQSRVHVAWALAIGPRLETRPRYPPTITFETFPFPIPTDAEERSVSHSAERLAGLRRGWLDPPGMSEEDLAARTLTSLYNQAPTWLLDAHAELDGAVLDAYGWPGDVDGEELLTLLLDLNLARAAST